MSVSETVSKILKDGGHTQTWAAKQMNLLNPDLNMNNTKLSAITTGMRKMSIEELVAFCEVTGISPDDFTNMALERTGEG